MPPDRSSTTGWTGMMRLAGYFYKQLYSFESCDTDCFEDLLKEVTSKKKYLDNVITFQEPSEATCQLSTDQSPEIDGLPVEFYQQFWDLIGADLFEAILECIGRKLLPTSRIFLSLF